MWKVNGLLPVKNDMIYFNRELPEKSPARCQQQNEG